jgi:hypothetical protein
MRICTNCKCQHKDPYKLYCKLCYYGLKKNPNYVKRTKRKELIGTPCKRCKKIREHIKDIDKDFCRKCYIKELFLKKSEYHEKFKKMCRDGKRKLAGIDPNLPLLKAPAGTGYVGSNGYKKICRTELRGHPNADKKGRMFEHTYIMSLHLGRPLYKGETIHHLNGIRHDNRLENLELRSFSSWPRTTSRRQS